MKNMTWRYCLLVVCLFWSSANQASSISILENQDLTVGPVSTIRPSIDKSASPPLQGIVIFPGRDIQTEAIRPLITNIGSFPSPISPSEPTFLALQKTPGLTHIGDYFDIEVVAFVPLVNAGHDELVLGFGFNSQLGGTGAAQFMGSSIVPLFTDISNQDGVNLAAAGVAFPGLSSNDVGSFISLAVLHFQAVTAGNLNIAITSDLSDPNQGLIFLTQAPLAIQANSSLTIAAVPLPPSVLLFISGLIMSAGRFWKRIG